MVTPREQVNTHTQTLRSHISILCKIPKRNTELIDSLNKLKVALHDHIATTDELSLLENNEQRDVQRLPLSCAKVASMQIDNMIIQCFTKDGTDAHGNPKTILDSQVEASELTAEVLAGTEEVKRVIDKHLSIGNLLRNTEFYYWMVS